VKWHLSVIRLTAGVPERLVELADRILTAWRGDTDADAVIFAQTNGEPHNTITPIARRRGEAYELDLVLRNNLTTQEHPLGLYHPHAELHHIKKENIGLIEVMGLAVLPARLKEELAAAEPSVIISRRPCVLLKHVKTEPPLAVDPAKCVGCRSCMRIGCPAIAIKGGKAHVDATLCVGCGVCEQLCGVKSFQGGKKEG